MFSGLTNQVSTWMGKKPENGSELPAEPKAASPDAETGGDLEKKNNTSPKGNKLEMFAGVKNQMSGWLSGGIPGLSRGAGTGEGEAPPPTETSESSQVPQEIQAPAGEQVKDDDASRWASDATGGADSGPASLEGTPIDDKNGQQAFGAVSTKALAGAKSLGGFLYSAVNKAGKTVVEASAKIKKTVEENRLIAELNKEQEAFIASKQTEKGEAVAPWVGAPNEDALREECLSLSTDRRNFVRAPPPGVEFAWDFEAVQPMAQATLALDPNLEAMRFELVPKVISEENFWRNYFYRVSLLRQGYELNSMASQAESNPPNQTIASTDSIDHTQEEDWERELEAELKDYEVVTGSSSNGQERSIASTRDVTASDNDWEKQIDELLANEDDEDLK
ncbi:synapse-associated protein of 47 kDa isoform X3 [Harpegnathos saltator]|uniref:synapse-associated protein of 47 kDa isoform X3 n=1 Tax=Harpegnathos saltator TaxID=610380 RepID=UPI00058BBE1E|nr:synapse-associated protein of 47 kDa isoform X3 [Harpegnathos saltator]